MRLLLLYLGLCLMLPDVLSLCPSGLVEVESWCYSFQGSYADVAGANSHCNTLNDGSKVVDIETEAEFNALTNWLTSK